MIFRYGFNSQLPVQVQSDQMLQFCAVWAIFGDPWVLFPKFHILLGSFGGKFLFSASNFWAKVFAILWALFHSKHLVTPI